MNIDVIQPEYHEGDDVTIKIDPGGGDHDTRSWVLLRVQGKRLVKQDSGEVQFDRDNPVRFVRSRKKLARGAYELRVWNKKTGKPPQDFSNHEARATFFVGPDPTINVVLAKVDGAIKNPDRDPCASFRKFANRVDRRTAKGGGGGPKVPLQKFYGAFGTANYEVIKRLSIEFAAECQCSSVFDLAPDGYENDRERQEPLLPAGLRSREFLPCVELIWNYWEEEGMLVQTLNHILARFQNRRVGDGFDALARFDISPLLPLRNLLWGWAEDEQHRLTLRRRAAEYEYEYGLTLIGRAIPSTRTLVERRSGFLEAFHAILYQAHVFYKELDDLTVNADVFPLYRSIRECHLILSQGSHNQYGEMAVAARAEMLVMQYILSQPPMREFLGGRPMTPYPEPWMDRVDTMKSIQGWPDTSIMHFHDLATIGERLVLTIRIGNWAATNVGAPQAALWATAFRPLIQKYVAAYRAVTGVDLSRGIDATMPSVLIARRNQSQRRLG